jgi:hypothetical protein
VLGNKNNGVFMKWFHRERVKNTKKDELRLGIASWDKGSGTSKSIKYTWFDKLGRAARGGEMPVEALEQAYLFAVREGYIKLKSRKR